MAIIIRTPGPKIADGILDNVVRTTRNIDVERLYIHHTDKSSKNIKIDIPKTSMDQIFQFIPSSTSDVPKTQYNVMTKVSRESLLGQPPDAGILDQGLEYLLVFVSAADWCTDYPNGYSQGKYRHTE